MAIRDNDGEPAVTPPPVAEIPRSLADEAAEQMPADHPPGETEDNDVVPDEEGRPAAKVARLADAQIPPEAEEADAEAMDYDQLLADSNSFQAYYCGRGQTRGEDRVVKIDLGPINHHRFIKHPQAYLVQ
jgi:hypothetical protein